MDQQSRKLEPITFDDGTIAALMELGEALRIVRDDLIAEGFQIKGDTITPRPTSV